MSIDTVYGKTNAFQLRLNGNILSGEQSAGFIPGTINSRRKICIGKLMQLMLCLVGRFPGGATADGIYDLAGNTWE
jgi:hypothetical protein